MKLKVLIICAKCILGGDPISKFNYSCVSVKYFFKFGDYFVFHTSFLLLNKNTIFGKIYILTKLTLNKLSACQLKQTAPTLWLGVSIRVIHRDTFLVCHNE